MKYNLTACKKVKLQLEEGKLLKHFKKVNAALAIKAL